MEKDVNDLLLKRMEDGFNSISKQLDNLERSVVKHAEKLSNQDVLNAQMTITQQQIVGTIVEIKENIVKVQSENKTMSDFMVAFTSSLNTFKWLFGLLGIGNVAIFLKVILGVI